MTSAIAAIVAGTPGWLTPEILALTLTAALIGLVHTVLGPDHYLPLVAMSRTAGWSFARTTAITAACGISHVLGSVVLGLIGLALGSALAHLEWVESVRGAIAAWSFLAFGLVYGVWGLRQAAAGRRHTHLHVHADRTIHSHPHDHRHDHAHVHTGARGPSRSAFVLFLLFVLGPCEALIPVLMVPAAQENHAGLVLVTGTFALTTIGTMVVLVWLGCWGAARVRLGRWHAYSHALAGGLVALCGGAMVLGL